MWIGLPLLPLTYVLSLHLIQFLLLMNSFEVHGGLFLVFVHTGIQPLRDQVIEAFVGGAFHLVVHPSLQLV